MMSLLRFQGRGLALGFSALTLMASGCSDNVPPSPQGAFTATFGNASGISCPATTPTARLQVGTIDGSQYVPVFDGENGATVACKVAPYQDGFVVSGSIQLGNSSFTMSGVLLGGSLTNEGLVVLSGSNTAGAYRPAADTTCKFTAVAVEPGRVWASFSCPHVEVAGKSGSDCSIYNGTVVLENCETE